MKPYLRDGVLPKSLYKETIKDIHTKVVTESKRKLINKVLGRAPPDIDPSEMSLPRLTRSTLSQIRSKYCNKLKTYQAKIGSFPDNICPVCRGAPHTTKHLFDCPAAPTNIEVLSLWKSPHGAADFLRSLPSFDHLPPNPLTPVLPLCHLLGHVHWIATWLGGLQLDFLRQTNQPTTTTTTTNRI
jgi:hypothetical protein